MSKRFLCVNRGEIMNKLETELSKWKQNEISVHKQQNRDTDLTMLQLGDVTLHKRPKTIDGYVSPFVLQLHGSGRNITSETTSAPLPYETYEITLEENFKANFQENKITIESDDVHYTITK